VHDLFGYKSGRHRQIADFLASKGWLVVMPDFYKGDNAPEMGNWWEKFIGFFRFLPFAYRTMRTSSAKANLEQLIQDEIFPWLEEKKVKKVQWLGFCWGAFGGAYLSKCDQLRATEDKKPAIIGGAACHSSLHGVCRFAPADEFDDLCVAMKHPFLSMPTKQDPADEKPGGKLEQLRNDAGLKTEIVEFQQSHGWTNRAPLTDPDVKADFEKSMTLITEFFTKNFEAAA